jgi:hypothetical protein
VLWLSAIFCSTDGASAAALVEWSERREAGSVVGVRTGGDRCGHLPGPSNRIAIAMHNVNLTVVGRATRGAGVDPARGLGRADRRVTRSSDPTPPESSARNTRIEQHWRFQKSAYSVLTGALDSTRDVQTTIFRYCRIRMTMNNSTTREGAWRCNKTHNGSYGNASQGSLQAGTPLHRR